MKFYKLWDNITQKYVKSYSNRTSWSSKSSVKNVMNDCIKKRSTPYDYIIHEFTSTPTEVHRETNVN